MIRHRSTAVAAALVAAVSLVSLSACASPDSPGASTGATSSTPEPSDSPSDGPHDPMPEASSMPVEAGARGLGLPPGVDGPTQGGTGAAWSAEPGLLYVVTYGSSTCPRVAKQDAVLDGADVVVTFEAAPDGACTMDLVPATSVVAVPDGVDPGAEVTARLGNLGSVVVPAATPGEAGQAAWVDADPPS